MFSISCNFFSTLNLRLWSRSVSSTNPLLYFQFGPYSVFRIVTSIQHNTKRYLLCCFYPRPGASRTRPALSRRRKSGDWTGSSQYRLGRYGTFGPGQFVRRCRQRRRRYVILVSRQDGFVNRFVVSLDGLLIERRRRRGRVRRLW